MHKLQKNQSGMVSIIVALVIMGILTLVAVGFAFLSRQEQRQALDRQLSTQAFYAAETGINDAVTNAINTEVDSCDSAEQDQIAPAAERSLDPASGVEYTCVLVDQNPTSLEFDRIVEERSTLVRVRTTNNVDKIKISWQDPIGDTNINFSESDDNYYLPQDKAIKGNATSAFFSTIAGERTADFPNHTGMLRATFIPTSAATSTNSLLNNSQTVFLYPEGNLVGSQAGTVDFRDAQQMSREGVFGPGECNVNNSIGFTPNFPKFCNTEIVGINENDFYLRLRAIYRPVTVTITATDGANNALEIEGAQVVVDATGKANDVLRRIQVRVPRTPDAYFPEFGIESANTICKRMQVWNGGAQVDPPSDYLYDGSAYGGQEMNDQAKDSESCRLPDATTPY